MRGFAKNVETSACSFAFVVHLTVSLFVMITHSLALAHPNPRCLEQKQTERMS